MYKIQIQTVLFNTEIRHLENWIFSILNCVKTLGDNFKVTVKIGVNDEDLVRHAKYIETVSKIDRENIVQFYFFSKNLGHGSGHNALSELDLNADYYWVINPDGYADLDCLLNLITNMQSSKRIAAAEARQIPFDHPKKFDVKSLDTSWVSGACVLFNGVYFRKIGGFDKLFFLHCDDVDISWRLRSIGARLLFCPNARFFHDKNIEANGHPSHSSAEAFHGLYGALLLVNKYDLLRAKRQISREIKITQPDQLRVLYSTRKGRPKLTLVARLRLRVEFRGIRKYYSGQKFSKNRFN